MASKSIRLALLNTSITVILAAWICVWILKPTRFWKRSWHKAEEWADATILREAGVNVIVFCFPLLAVAVLVYISLHLLQTRVVRTRKRNLAITSFSNPLIASSPVGILSSLELICAALFIVFLAWTYYSNVSSDLQRMTPPKSLQLNRLELKVMAVGVRFGSLTEACLALLFLPVLRGMALFTICGVQFEASVRYHVWLGNAVMFFSILHGGTIMSVWGSQNALWNEITRWQKTGRVYLAGMITLLTVLVIWITSLPPLRRKNFKFFYFCHHLYIVFITFFLLHAGTGHFHLVFSGVFLFALDKTLRIMQSQTTTSVISIRTLPCRAVELTVPKDPCMLYSPMSTLFIKIPSISKFEWHPFSITSSSHMEDDRLSLIIKCEGPWTNSLYNMVCSIEEAKVNDRRSLDISVEGPYGPTNFTCQRYGSLVLIAGGSGITPLLSILQDVAYRSRSAENHSRKIQLIYAVRKSEDLSMLAPVSSFLLNQTGDLKHLQLRLFVTRENQGPWTSVEEMLNDISRLKTIVLDQGSRRDVVQGREPPLVKAIIAGLASTVYLFALVSLTHAFIHKGKRASQNKTPSWVSDALVICSFVIALGCSTTAAMILNMWRRSLKGYPTLARVHKTALSSQIDAERTQDVCERHEINFGQRPNLEGMLLEQSSEADQLKVGVFVCGPDSMQESVASFCRKHSRKDGTNAKRDYVFHSINFSL